MVNMDYPGVCMSCTTPECKVEAPDIAAVVKRLKDDPLTGYTLNLVNNLTTAMPDKFKNREEAYLAVDVMKAVIAMGLKNRDHVDIHGLGEFRVEGEKGRRKVVFVVDPALTAAVNE